jgi:hypothetical protein
MQKLLPYGMKKVAIGAVVDMVIDGVERHGAAALAQLIDKKARIEWNLPINT